MTTGADGGKVLMIGSGGHARAVMGVALSAGLKVVGCIAPGDPNSQTVMGVPVIGDDESLPGLFASGVRSAIVAIGDNRRRVELGQRLMDIGFLLENVISSGATIGLGVRLGQGIVVMPQVVVNGPTEIGDLVILNTRCGVDHDCAVDRGVHLAPGVTVCGSVDIGEGAFVGAGAVVTPDLRIGAWSTIGAGAVAVRPVRDGSVVIGVPAKER